MDFFQWLNSVTSEKTKQDAFKYLRNCDERAMKIIDDTPKKWLDFHLENAVKEEHFELAEYIRKSKELRI